MINSSGVTGRRQRDKCLNVNMQITRNGGKCLNLYFKISKIKKNIYFACAMLHTYKMDNIVDLWCLLEFRPNGTP